MTENLPYQELKELSVEESLRRDVEFYKKLYFKLFKNFADLTEIVMKAQQETEEMYISNPNQSDIS